MRVGYFLAQLTMALRPEEIGATTGLSIPPVVA